VVGAGHAGSEAAQAAILVQNLLVTMSLQNIAQMSCNPAMGGIKGQIVRELMRLVVLWNCLRQDGYQFKMLNKSKGLRCGRQEFKVTVCGLKNGR
jgi:tRNA uridine 5-carboxymethylaminomethyl modification enzyme